MACAGNDNLHVLTIFKRQHLRVDFADFEGNTSFAEYDNFRTGWRHKKYKLISLGKYSGTAGQYYHFPFSDLTKYLNALSMISCCSHIHELRCVRPYCDFVTASTIITSDGDSPLSLKSVIANDRYCHVMYKLLYPSIRVRTAPPVSVRVRVRVSVSFSLRILFCMCGSLQ